MTFQILFLCNGLSSNYFCKDTIKRAKYKINFDLFLLEAEVSSKQLFKDTTKMGNNQTFEEEILIDVWGMM